DGHDILLRAVTFGAIIPKWRTMAFYEAPSVGRLPQDESDWSPEQWKPHIMNGAFRHARADDKFWAAYKMTYITNAMIEAAIKEGHFNDPPSEQMLAKMIRERRDRILQTYLPAVNPIVAPELSADGLLTFKNAAVEAAVSAAPAGYHAAWSVFDNATGESRALGNSDATTMSVRAPALPSAGFVKVEIAAAAGAPEPWTRPVTAYFRHAANGWA